MKHVYKGFGIVNAQKLGKLKRPAFHIMDGDLKVAATPTLRSAHWLIDVWKESPYCACGEPHVRHDHRCKKCIKKGAPNESHRQRDRVA